MAFDVLVVEQMHRRRLPAVVEREGLLLGKIAALEEMPGVDVSALRAFEADTDAAVEAESVAEAEEAEAEEEESVGAVTPPPETPPGPAILVEDEYAGARERWIVSSIVASLTVALLA